MKPIAFLFVAATILAPATFAVAPSMAIAAAPAADISGTWTTSFDSMVGEQTYTYTFDLEGETLTGHAKSNVGEGDLKGTVDGDKVTFVENLDYQGQALAITYTGQIVSADEIKFSRDVAGQGGEEFLAKRQK
jgi:ABC-type transport system substrate-binding protein